MAEEGWRGIENGELIRRASDGFDVLLTGDQNLVHQQNVAGVTLGFVIIETHSLRVGVLRRVATEISEAITEVEPGGTRIVRVSLDDDPAPDNMTTGGSG